MEVKKKVNKATLNSQQKKKLFLKAFGGGLINVTEACVATGISRTLAYKWKEADKIFAESWREIEEEFYDKLENAMFKKAIDDQDNTMLIWLSKTKLKHRGYVEKTEQDIRINEFEAAMKCLPDDE